MRRITVHLSLLMLVCALPLAACGNDGDAGSTATSPVTGPGKNASDEPTLPTLPAPRGPALRVDAKYTYKVQVLDAMTTLSLPEKPPPAGTTALAVLLRIEADPPNRPISAPAQDLQIIFPSCYRDQNQYLACQLDGGTDFFTEDQMRFGWEGAKGISGLLEAKPRTTAGHGSSSPRKPTSPALPCARSAAKTTASRSARSGRANKID